MSYKKGRKPKSCLKALSVFLYAMARGSFVLLDNKKVSNAAANDEFVHRFH